jgi:hypothetical protein
MKTSNLKFKVIPREFISFTPEEGQDTRVEAPLLTPVLVSGVCSLQWAYDSSSTVTDEKRELIIRTETTITRHYSLVFFLWNDRFSAERKINGPCLQREKTSINLCNCEDRSTKDRIRSQVRELKFVVLLCKWTGRRH